MAKKSAEEQLLAHEKVTRELLERQGCTPDCLDCCCKMGISLADLLGMFAKYGPAFAQMLADLIAILQQVSPPSPQPMPMKGK